MTIPYPLQIFDSHPERPWLLFGPDNSIDCYSEYESPLAIYIGDHRATSPVRGQGCVFLVSEFAIAVSGNEQRGLTYRILSRLQCGA